MGFHTSKHLRFENIVGLETLKKYIEIKLDATLNKQKELKRIRLNPKFGILLIGPPGTGKTLFAKTLANEIDGYYTEITASDIQGFPGEAESRIIDKFNTLLSQEKAVLFIDEAEWILRKRDVQISSVMQRVTPTLLHQWSRIFEYEENYNLIFIIMASNKPDVIDEAFLRPGRFDAIFYVSPPDKSHIKEMLEKFLNGVKSNDVNTEDIYNMLEKKRRKKYPQRLYSGADIYNLVKQAKVFALSDGRIEVN